MPAKLAEVLGLTDTVRAIPIVEPEVTHSIGLVVPQRNPLTPLINALVSEAKLLAPFWAAATCHRCPQPSAIRNPDQAIELCNQREIRLCALAMQGTA